MPEKKPHFEIPKERVHSTPIKVRGRSKPYSRPNYSVHGDYLRERAKAIRAYTQDVADSIAAESVFMQVRTPELLPARGERERLKHAGLEIVALSAIDANSATVKLRKADLNRFERKIDKYATSPKNTGRSYLSVIEDIGPVPLEEKLSRELIDIPDEPIDCLLLFYSSLTEKERAAVLLTVRSFMARTGMALGPQRRLSNGVTVVEARLRPSDARAAGAAFSTLREITPNNVFFVPDAWHISDLPPDIQVLPPKIDTAVAVIDTGISPTCFGIAGVITEVRPFLPAGAVAAWPEHGTFVASRVIYGDGLEDSLRSGVLRPLCPLVDVPIIGVDARGGVVSSNEGHVADAIDRVIPMLPQAARVVNISLGTNSSVVDGSISIVAQLIDKHARDHDLLIVTTAGNIRDPRLLNGFPHSLSNAECRIDPPGDSLIAITVGSIAKHWEDGALSQPRELSAFSRRGPGPLGGSKPELVAHGGNCKKDFATSARIATHGLSPSGWKWACDCGTSFAAPLVSAIGAQLFEHYPEASANLVRALLIHFADSVISPAIAIPAEHLVGVGEPNVDSACWAGDHSATYLHMGELTSNQFDFLPFFVPSCLAEDGQGRLKIKVTVAIDPPVNPDNQIEYAQARVGVALHKPNSAGHAKIGVAKDLLDTDKWCPLVQFERTFRRSYEIGEWQLQLRLFTRGLDADFRQRYAVVIEVIDDTGTLPVHDEVEAQAGAAYRNPHISAAA